MTEPQETRQDEEYIHAQKTAVKSGFKEVVEDHSYHSKTTQPVDTGYAAQSR